MLCLIFILIDQFVKYYIYVNKPSIILIKDYLEITYAENTGTLFGIAQDSNFILIIVSLIIISILTFVLLRKTQKYSFRRTLWQIIIAGGVSNLIDRVWRGFVIDYVGLKFFGVCNIADFCIVFGVIILAIYEINDLKRNKEVALKEEEERMKGN